MSRSKSESLLGLTESFFHNYLKQTRGASGHTVRAYRDALKLFYLFLADRKRKPVADLALDDIQSDALLAFLDHVESHPREHCGYPKLPSCRGSQFCAAPPAARCNAGRPVRSHSSDSQQKSTTTGRHLSGT